MNVPFVDLSRQFKPVLGDIKTAHADIIERCAFINGPEVKNFEQDMAAWLGLDSACGVGSGTHALYLTLRSLGVGPGDEVITVVNTACRPVNRSICAGPRLFLLTSPPALFLSIRRPWKRP